MIFIKEINVRSFVCLFQDGWSALLLAVANGFTEIVKHLIEANASPGLQTKVEIWNILPALQF